MSVERLLQINIATLVAMSTFMVGMGQEDAILPLAMLAMAMISLWVTDITGVFHLNRAITRIAEITALAISIPGALRLDKHAMIASVGLFLMCLQAIHLFQKKDSRTYTLLLRLSLLQVVVATMLSQGYFFGALLILYLFTALSALFLLFLYSERLGYTWAGGPIRIVERSARWPLARQPPSLVGPGLGGTRVEREMFFRLFNVGAVTLAISVLVFFTIPRLGQGAWRGSRLSAHGSVGFSDSVTLGQLGEILQNPEEVLRASFVDGTTGRQDCVSGEVYFRGAVLMMYSQRQWYTVRRSEWALPRVGARGAAPLLPMVQQKLMFQPSAGDDLFCVWPVVFPLNDDRINYDPQLDRLNRRVDVRPQEPYELRTTAFARGEQSVLVPTEAGVAAFSLLHLDRDRLPSLVALAEQWSQRSSVPREDHFGRARHFERMLRDSGQFRYSLEGQPRDTNLDPIEDFIANNPRGHCEYFATALALMLRSQGIPTRVIVGFRSNEWNRVGEPFLQVRQLHAHTWVEAYLDWEHLPEGLRQEAGIWQYGGWLRLDATPAAGDEAAAGFWVRGPGKYLDWLDFAWARYVLEMDRPRQHQAIYGPLAALLRDAIEAVCDPDWWRGLLAQVREALGLDRLHQPGGAWFNWRAFAAVFAAGTLLLVGTAGARLLWKRWAAVARSRGPVRRRSWPRVEFYRRLEAALARYGFVRSPSLTQREFALEAGRRLAERSVDGQLALAPLQVVDAFYRVRFGQVLLDKSQSEEVEQALLRLERAAEGSRQ